MNYLLQVFQYLKAAGNNINSIIPKIEETADYVMEIRVASNEQKKRAEVITLSLEKVKKYC